MVTSIETSGARLAEVARGNLDKQVEHCPDWDVAGMLNHVAGVYRFITANVENVGADAPASVDREDVPDGDGIVDYFIEKHAALVAALRAVDPKAEAWNWGTGSTVDFYHRRMLHETAIHQWDVENAAGTAGAKSEFFDADVAHDGIDEVIEVGMQASPRGPRSEFPSGSLHLHRTDGDGEWMLQGTDDGLVVTQEHGKGDCAVRGTASALYLYMWGRVAADDEATIQIFGDEELVAAWAEVSP